MIREIVELEGANPYARRLEFYEGNRVLGYADYSLIYDRIELDNILIFKPLVSQLPLFVAEHNVLHTSL